MPCDLLGNAPGTQIINADGVCRCMCTSMWIMYLRITLIRKDVTRTRGLHTLMSLYSPATTYIRMRPSAKRRSRMQGCYRAITGHDEMGPPEFRTPVLG